MRYRGTMSTPTTNSQPNSPVGSEVLSVGGNPPAKTAKKPKAPPAAKKVSEPLRRGDVVQDAFGRVGVVKRQSTTGELLVCVCLTPLEDIGDPMVRSANELDKIGEIQTTPWGA